MKGKCMIVHFASTSIPRIACLGAIFFVVGEVLAMEAVVVTHKPTFRRSKTVAEKTGLRNISPSQLGETIISLTHAERDVLHDVYYLLFKKVYPTLQPDPYLCGTWNGLWKSLIDPELLIDKDAILKKITYIAANTEVDSFFTKFQQCYQMIDGFLKNMDHPKSLLSDQDKTLCTEALTSVTTFYKAYVTRLIDLAKTVVKAKNSNDILNAYSHLTQHLEIKAIMMGDVFKQGIYWRITQDLARHLVQIDPNGRRLEKKGSGVHPVCFLPEGEAGEAQVYFKSDSHPPLKPGMEAKTFEHYRLFDIPISTSGFLAIFNVLANGVFIKTPYFLQVSNAIRGQNAIVFFEPDEETGEKKTLPPLDEDLYVRQVIGALLTDPNDGKSENFVVNGETRSFISIDNDEVFQPGLNRDRSIALKSVLLMLPDMDKSIRLRMRAPFLRDPELMILSLEQALYKRNKKYNAMLSQLSCLVSGIDSNILLTHFSLPIPYTSVDKDSLFRKLQIIKRMFQSRKNHTTSQTLFEATHPLIGPKYRELREKIKDPQTIYETLFRDLIEVNDETAEKTHSGSGNGDEEIYSPRLNFQDRVIQTYLQQWLSGFFEPKLVLKDLKALLNMRPLTFSDSAQGLLFLIRCDAQFSRLNKKNPVNKKWVQKWETLRTNILDKNPVLKSLYDVVFAQKKLGKEDSAHWTNMLSALDFSQLQQQERMLFLNNTLDLDELITLSLRNCADIDDTWIRKIDLKNLRALSLEGCDPVTQESIVYLVKNAPCLEHLFFNNKHVPTLNYFPEKGPGARANIPLKALACCATETTLSLSRVTLRDQDLFLIALLATQNPTFSYLDFFCVPLTLKEIGSLMNIASLKEVKIEEGNVDDAMVGIIMKNPHLEKLLLWKNKITMDGILHIMAHENLKELGLYKNDIGDSGALLLSQHKTLETLDLRECGITNTGAKAFSNNKTLKMLHLRYNKITDEGAQCFLKNTTLTDLDLGRNEVSPAVLDAVTSHINSNKR